MTASTVQGKTDIMRSVLLYALITLACTNASAQTAVVSHLHHEAETRFRELPPPTLMQGIGEAIVA